jgi:flavorubredoxin
VGVEVEQTTQQDVLVDLEVAEAMVQVAQKQEQVRPVKEQMVQVVEKVAAAVEPVLQQALTMQVVVVYLLLLQVQLLLEAVVDLKKVVVGHPHLEQVAAVEVQEMRKVHKQELLILAVVAVEPAETLTEPALTVEKVLLF